MYIIVLQNQGAILAIKIVTIKCTVWSQTTQQGLSMNARWGSSNQEWTKSSVIYMEIASGTRSGNEV